MSLFSGVESALTWLGDEFKEIGGTIKNFGLDVADGVEGIVDVGRAGFDYVEEFAKFVADSTKLSFDFVKSILSELIKLVPLLIDLFRTSIQLLKYGYTTSVVLLLIAPALGIYYLTTYYIQLLERRY